MRGPSEEREREAQSPQINGKVDRILISILINVLYVICYMRGFSKNI